jgi:DNA processing protein
MQTSGEVIHQAALAQVSGVGARMIRELKTVFGSYQAAWEAHPAEWLDVPGATPGLRDRFEEHRNSLDTEAFAKRLRDSGIFILGLDQPGYPEQLAVIDSPPPVLYARGRLEPLLPDKIAIVGTRKASEYYVKHSRKTAYELASLGLTVVSGMALGIDTAAHEGALDAQGMTIAVLGCGVDVVYPPQNDALYRRLIEQALVVSEFAPGAAPIKENFPKRNRIIAGLSHGVVVAEAPIASGALITARFAIDAGREVFAFPGYPGKASSLGGHQLIKSGQAKLIDDADDIVGEWPQRKSELLAQQLEKLKGELQLPLELPDAKAKDAVPAEQPSTPKGGAKPAQPKEQAAPKPARVAKKAGEIPEVQLREEEVGVLGHVSYERSHINDFARATGLSIAELAARLTMLELKGLVKSLPGGYYTRL